MFKLALHWATSCTKPWAIYLNKHLWQAIHNLYNTICHMMQIAMLKTSNDNLGVLALSLIWELQLTGANSWLTRQTISPVLCSSTSVSFRGSTNSYTGSTKRHLKQKCYVHWFCKFWYHRWPKNDCINIIKPATNSHGEKTQPQKSATNFEYKFDNKINACC